MTADVENAALQIVKAVVERKSHPAIEIRGRLTHIGCDRAPRTGLASTDSPRRSGDLRNAVARLMGTRSEYERLPSRESGGSLVYGRRARD